MAGQAERSRCILPSPLARWSELRISKLSLWTKFLVDDSASADPHLSSF